MYDAIIECTDDVGSFGDTQTVAYSMSVETSTIERKTKYKDGALQRYQAFFYMVLSYLETNKYYGVCVIVVGPPMSNIFLLKSCQK